VYGPDPNIPGNIIWSGKDDSDVTYTLGWYQSRYFPGTNIELVNSFYRFPAKSIQFNYFEDDFFMNQYDIFDDWCGSHKGGRLVTQVNGQAANVGFQTGTFSMRENLVTAQYTIY
jgi:hypothetical protein